MLCCHVLDKMTSVSNKVMFSPPPLRSLSDLQIYIWDQVGQPPKCHSMSLNVTLFIWCLQHYHQIVILIKYTNCFNLLLGRQGHSCMGCLWDWQFIFIFKRLWYILWQNHVPILLNLFCTLDPMHVSSKYFREIFKPSY